MVAWIESAEGTRSLSGVLLALTTVTTGLRLFARRCQRTYLGKDDYLMIAGYLTYVGVVASLLVGVTDGYVGYAKYSGLIKTVYKMYIANDMLVAASFGCVKLSVLFFYQRVFCISGHWDAFRIVTTFFAIISGLWTVAYFIIPPLQCGPRLSDLWEPQATEFCRIGYLWTLSQSISDLILELSLLLIPIPRIYSLHMTLKRKIGISVVFLASFVSFGASIARLVIFVRAEKLEAVGRISSPLLSNTSLLFMNALEAGMAIVAANLPSLYYLRNLVSPENIARSVRSMLSLSSIKSRPAEDGLAGESSGFQEIGASLSNVSDDVTSYGLVPESKACQHTVIVHDGSRPKTENESHDVFVKVELAQRVENV